MPRKPPRKGPPRKGDEVEVFDAREWRLAKVLRRYKNIFSWSRPCGNGTLGSFARVDDDIDSWPKWRWPEGKQR